MGITSQRHRAVVVIFMALLAAIAFAVLYLGALGHISSGDLSPPRLAVALTCGLLLFSGVLVASERRLNAATAEEWYRVPRRAFSVAFVSWLAIGALIGWWLLWASHSRETVPNLLSSLMLLPAWVAGVTAYFVYEDLSRTALETLPSGAPPPTSTRLRTRLVLTLFAAAVAPVALLASALWHFEEHGRAEGIHLHDEPNNEEHAPLMSVVALVGGAAGLAGVAFGLLASRSLSRPILALAGAMERVQAGELATRLPVFSSDETGRAAKVFNTMVEGLAERAWLRETFGRYVSGDVADALRAGRVALHGEQRRATMLFADIRGFTRMSESMPAPEVLTFVNDYLRAMTAVIVRHRGRLDKVMGDGIMVVFGAPLDDPQHARNAVRTALEMRAALVDFNAGRAAVGKAAIEIGIGIHSGEVVAGNVGVESHKVEYTVLGDTVNLASRLEGLTKELGADILTSQATFEAAGEGIEAADLGERPIRGHAAPVRVRALKRLLPG